MDGWMDRLDGLMDGLDGLIDGLDGWAGWKGPGVESQPLRGWDPTLVLSCPFHPARNPSINPSNQSINPIHQSIQSIHPSNPSIQSIHPIHQSNQSIHPTNPSIQSIHPIHPNQSISPLPPHMGRRNRRFFRRNPKKMGPDFLDMEKVVFLGSTPYFPPSRWAGPIKKRLGG